MPGFTSSAENILVNTGITQVISTSELRSIFSMRRRTWKDGTPIRVFVLPDQHPVHKSFCKNILGIFPHRLRKSWDRLVFTGIGQAPTEVNSLQEMNEMVMKTPGAIGYSLQGLADDTLQNHSMDKTDEQ